MNKNDVFVKFAKEIRARDNKEPLGAMLGIILKPLPDIEIQLLNGHGKLDKEQIYLSNAITNRLAIECTMKSFESRGNSYLNQSMNSNNVSDVNTTGSTPPVVSSHSGSINSISSSSGNNEKENKDKGKFILQTVFNLKKGMYVLVIPNIEEDKYFVVDVFNYAPEVSLEWEYYQK